jgi:hypothetical protein
VTRYHLGLCLHAASLNLAAQRFQAPRELSIRPERREVGGHVCREGSGELGPVQEQKPSTGGRIGAAGLPQGSLRSRYSWTRRSLARTRRCRRSAARINQLCPRLPISVSGLNLAPKQEMAWRRLDRGSSDSAHSSITDIHRPLDRVTTLDRHTPSPHTAGASPPIAGE